MYASPCFWYLVAYLIPSIMIIDIDTNILVGACMDSLATNQVIASLRKEHG